MRRSVIVIVSCLAVASAIACVDLFHSTTDVQSLCEKDASDPACRDAGDAALPVTLCAPEAGVAEQWAIEACAWLAACEDPIGQNVTGVCIANAILAYDCNANPNQQPQGLAHDYWACLRDATTGSKRSCAAVAACVFPAQTPTCKNGTFIGCTQTTDSNQATRVECTKAGPARGENCSTFGQKCDSLDPDGSNGSALCVGAQRRTCATVKCTGTELARCDDAGVDIGFDCAMFGASACVATGAAPACKPGGTTSGCAASTDVTCTAGGVAKGCASGFVESVDCNAVSGPSSCHATDAGGPSLDPASACYASGGCSSDTCSGNLVACVRGRIVTIDCQSLGLSPCSNTIATTSGAGTACTSPP